MSEIFISNKGIINKILYPSKCAVCGRMLEYPETYVCGRCYKTLPFIHGNRCIKCSKEVPEGTSICNDCQKLKHIYRQGYSVFKYDVNTRRIIAGLKYSGKKEYAEGIVEDMVYHSRMIMKRWQPELIIPVPLHISKKRQRGFNQAEVLAWNFARTHDICLADRILVRRHKTLPQRYFDDKARAKNLKDAFAVNMKELNRYPGVSRVLLFDDIYTTGSTIDACTAVLMSAGIKHVYFMCMCIGNGC